MKKRAFTLFELILAMAVVAIVTSVIAVVISTAFSIKRSAERTVEATRDLEVVGDIFVHEVANAVQPNPSSAEDTSAAAGSTTLTEVPLFLAGPFYGESGILQFYTTGYDPHGDVQGDLRYVELTIKQAAGVNVFVHRQHLNLLEEIATDPTDEVLATNVEDLRFAYYDGTSWVDTWDTTTNGNLLPYAVAIELTLAPLHAGEPSRIIRRFAPVVCVAPSTQTSTGVTN